MRNLCIIMSCCFGSAVVAGVVAGCGEAVAWPSLTGLPFNLHEVDPGLLYRSAQPRANELARAIDELGIRTVINLRGENTGKPWYDDEARVCAEKGVTLVNFAMSAKRLPAPDILAKCIETFQTAEYPILMHCNGGADRTGMMSAVYRMVILNHPRKEALEELSERYLHYRWYTPCMDTLAERFEVTPAWLDQYAETWDTIVCE